jgi:hypothetical protein
MSQQGEKEGKKECVRYEKSDKRRDKDEILSSSKGWMISRIVNVGEA